MGGLALFEDLLHLLIQVVQPGKEILVAGIQLQENVEFRGSVVHFGECVCGGFGMGNPNRIGLPGAEYPAKSETADLMQV